ncbi:MAG: hypothetical protein CSA50_01970 [Gammaproteobacteria bacterium]|nr:MAG: hypothetical protein CSA50_01970 [Gammaproteobacteria bacterium]
MKKQILLLTIICFFTTSEAQQTTNDIEELDKLLVEGDAYSTTTTTVKLLPESSAILKDTADVLKKIPGAYVNKNGTLSGVAQYRGLFGSRVNVNADGVPVMESCSNAMDAPMSHVPASMVDAVVLQRGISRVSQNIETLGGSINVIGKSVDEHADGFSGDANLAYASANQGKTGSANLHFRQDQHAFSVGLDIERGNNQDTPVGENVFTGLERDYYTASYLYDTGNHRLVLSTNYNDTGETGTPALPMDITYARGGISRLEFSRTINDDWEISSELAYQYTKHLMDSYRHRNQPAARFREALTRVKRQAFSLTAQKSGANNDDLVIGIDIDDINNSAFISNPNNAMFNIINFDVSKNRLSVFAEYQRQLSDSHQYMIGIRWTDSDAGSNQVDSSVAMMNNDMGQLHRTLRDRFNSSERNKTDKNLDFMLNWQQTINNQLSFEYGFAIKNRAPTHQERYLWLPLEATAGLADGRRYLGNLDLQSEQAMQWEFGVNYQKSDFTAAPHLFYHRIDDYIQGVPNTVMPAPPGVLRFANVEAELYGFDVELSYQINEQFSMRNVTSVVRGKRRDIDDDLYRVAPINTWFNFSYRSSNWQFDADLMAALRQDRVSVTNSERETPGFGVLHLTAIRSLNQNSYIKLAVNNVFDKLYYQHTNGYNRNNRNQAVGFDPNNLQAFRLPAEGRGVQVSYFYQW